LELTSIGTGKLTRQYHLIRLYNSVTDSTEDVSPKSALNACETWVSQYSNGKS